MSNDSILQGILVKTITKNWLSDGIFELFMTGRLNEDKYSEEDSAIIREVYQKSSLEKKCLFKIFEEISQFSDDEILKKFAYALEKME